MSNLTTIADIQSRMLMVRGNPSLLDRDVAALYGLETKRVLEAVRNNPDKFPAGYIIELDKNEEEVLRSKISSLEKMPGKGHYSKHGYWTTVHEMWTEWGELTPMIGAPANAPQAETCFAIDCHKTIAPFVMNGVAGRCVFGGVVTRATRIGVNEGGSQILKLGQTNGVTTFHEMWTDSVERKAA